MVFQILILLCIVVKAAEGYKIFASEVVSPYDLNRTNFCSLNYDNVAVKIASFADQQILVAVDVETNPFYFSYDPVSFAPSGLMFNILTEIENRGGFQFIYAYVPHLSGSTDSRLRTFASHTDIVANTWWTDTPGRRSEGFEFTSAVVDSSLVFVTTTEEETVQFDPWKFLEPYSKPMWLCLLSFILFHSLMLWAIEGKFAMKSTEDDENKTIWSYLYFSWAALTGMGEPEAQHPSAAFLNLGFLFFMMVFAAGYTANLASILITPPVTINKFNSLDDANSKGATVCLVAGSAAQTYFSAVTTYDNINWDVTGVNSSVVMRNVATGYCDGAVFANIDWESLSVLSSINPNCNLVQTGAVIAPLGGSFIYLPDDSYNCTSLVDEVVSYYLTGMKNDGTLDTLLADAISDKQDLDCSGSGDSSGSAQLTLSDLAGTFFVYLIAMLFAIVAFFVKHGVLREKFMDSSSKLGSEVSNSHHIQENRDDNDGHKLQIDSTGGDNQNKEIELTENQNSNTESEKVGKPTGESFYNSPF